MKPRDFEVFRRFCFIETDRKLEWNYRGTLKKFYFLVVFFEVFSYFCSQIIIWDNIFLSK